MGGIYQGICRDAGLDFEGQAIRLKQSSPCYQFNDLFKGTIEVSKEFADEDYIIKRRDGLFAYQLVVVLDDIEQNISHIVRCVDLLDPTVRQISLFKLLNAQTPEFGHLPLVVAEPGFKLSKQNYAKAIDIDKPEASLFAAISFLGLNPPSELQNQTVTQMLAWAIANWSRSCVPQNNEIQFIEQPSGFTFKPL